MQFTHATVVIACALLVMSASHAQQLGPGWCDTYEACARQTGGHDAGGTLTGGCPLEGTCDDPALRDASIPDASIPDASTPLKTLRPRAGFPAQPRTRRGPERRPYGGD